MYSMIIADDEPVILDGLCRMLDWHTLDITIAGKFLCGKDVIDFLDVNPCDILITDINMPEKNGLDILKYIKERKLHTQTIFISGFSEFSYAHEALHNGAADYITKPINKDILLDAVEKSIRFLNRNDTRLEKKLIDYGIINSVNMDIANAKKTDDEFYTAINVYPDTTCLSKQQHDLLIFSFTASIEKLLTMNNIVFERGHAICIIISHSARDEALKAADSIMRVIREQMSINAVIIIGGTAEGTSEIPNSFKSAEKLEYMCFYCDAGTVIDCENPPELKTTHISSDISDIEKSAVECMYKPDGNELTEAVNDIAEKINTLSGFMPNTFKAYVISVLHRLNTEIRTLNNNKSFTSRADDMFTKFSEQINLASRFFKVKNLIYECMLEAKKLLNELDFSSVDAIIKSKDFIKSHYSENITLESVANNVYMNSFYFSSFFKKHTGKNFKEYLNEIRLENAVRLLVTSNLRLSEIAEKTGFKSLRRMNELFLKVYGETPNEYRKKFNKRKV